MSDELVIRRGRPAGIAAGLLAGGVVGAVLVARTSLLLAALCLALLVVVALVVPPLIGTRQTVLRDDVLFQGKRNVDLARLSGVRYVPGWQGPARLEVRDAGGRRLSIPLPSTGTARQELLARVARAALDSGVAMDERTRRRLGAETPT